MPLELDVCGLGTAITQLHIVTQTFDISYYVGASGGAERGDDAEEGAYETIPSKKTVDEVD